MPDYADCCTALLTAMQTRNNDVDPDSTDGLDSAASLMHRLQALSLSALKAVMCVSLHLVLALVCCVITAIQLSCNVAGNLTSEEAACYTSYAW